MSFDVFETFATDENLENSGVVHKLGKGASLLVARAGNRAYVRALSKAVEARSPELNSGDEDQAAAVSDEIIIDVMSKTILLGWEKLSFKGEDLGEYSSDKAKKLLAVKDFRKMVSSIADRMDLFKVKSEVQAGNA